MRLLRLLSLLFIPLLAFSLSSPPADSPASSAPDEEPVELRAVRELGERIRKGDPEAAFRLAGLYSRGWGSVAKDSLRADSLLRVSASAQYPPAMNLLGYRLLDASGKRSDEPTVRDSLLATALSLMEEAAYFGDADAAANLGFIYTRGEKVPPDSLRALDWFRQSMIRGNTAAGPGLLELKERFPSLEVDSATMGRAYLLSGNAFARGEGGMPYDYRESLRMFRKSAEFGNREAADIIRELLGQFPDALDGL